MKKAVAGIVSSLLLGLLVAFTMYSASNPQYRRTKKDAEKFFEAAEPGRNVADVLEGSPPFKSVQLGACGSLATTTDTGKKAFVFAPAVGPYEKYPGLVEFLAHYPQLFADHDECRHLAVTFMNGYVDKSRVDVDVDGHGRILSKKEPVYYN